MVQHAVKIKACARDLLNAIQKSDAEGVQTKLLEIKMDHYKHLVSIINMHLTRGSILDTVCALEGERALDIVGSILDVLEQAPGQGKLTEIIGQLNNKQKQLQEAESEEMSTDSTPDSQWVQRMQRQVAGDRCR